MIRQALLSALRPRPLASRITLSALVLAAGCQLDPSVAGLDGDCPPAEVKCNGACVNPLTDSAFCGASGDCLHSHAGEACGAGQSCQAGVCEPNSEQPPEVPTPVAPCSSPQPLVVIDATDAGGAEAGHEIAKAFDGAGFDDGDADSRWAHSGLPTMVVFDLGGVQKLCTTRFSFYKFNSGRIYTYSVAHSVDGGDYQTAVDHGASAATEWTEAALDAVDARYVQLTIHAADPSTNWASLWETEFAGTGTGTPVVTPPPAVGIPAGTSLTPSGPIIISDESNVTISGKKISNPNGHCIEIKNGSTNITIKNSEIGPCKEKGVIVTTGSGHVDIHNNYFHDITKDAVWSYEVGNVTVDSNVIMRVERGFGMWTTGKGNLSFTNNYVKNIVGAASGNGRGGNVAMAAYVNGPNIRINNNVAINELGKSSTEDLVNLYKSGGTVSDPIQVNNNRFKGGGPSWSGGGIILGDEGGKYQIAENNILVNPGSYGIAAGAPHTTLRNNKVYSDNDPVNRYWAGVGAVLQRYNNGGDGTQPGDCFDVKVEGNEITFWQVHVHQDPVTPFLSPTWYPDYGNDEESPNCDVTFINNKFDTSSSQPANLDASIWNPAWDTPDGVPVGG